MKKAILILTKNNLFFEVIKRNLLAVFGTNTLAISKDIAQRPQYIYIYRCRAS